MKAAVTGSGTSNKDAVTKLVTKILRLDAPPRPADAADALALAITHAWRAGIGTSSKGAGTTGPGSLSLTPAQRAWADAGPKRAAHAECPAVPPQSLVVVFVDMFG